MRLSLYGVLTAAAIGSGCAHAPSIEQYAVPTSCATNYLLPQDSRLVSLITQLPPGTMRHAYENGVIEYRSELSLRPKTPIGANTLIATGFTLEIGDIVYRERMNQKETLVEATFKYGTERMEHVLLCESTNATGEHTEKQGNMHFLGTKKAESALLTALQSMPPIQTPPLSSGFRMVMR